MDELRKEHDDLLANKPEGMTDEDFAELIDQHKENCIICNEDKINDNPEGGDIVDKTFTQEELDAAVLSAVAPIQKELDDLKSQAVEGEVAQRVADAKAEGEAAVAELQGQLDAAMNEKGVAETELANVLAYLKAEAEAVELAELYTAVKEERKAKIQEAASFAEEYIDANIDRWSKVDEEEFAAMLEDWKNANASKAEKEEVASDDDSSTDTATAIKAVRSVESGSVIKGDLANLFDAAKAGFDIRKV